MKRGRALNMNRSSYLRARALADRVITETLKRDPDRVVRAITFAVEKLNSPLTKCLFSQDDGPSACSRRSELGWRYGRGERSEWPRQRRHR